MPNTIHKKLSTKRHLRMLFWVFFLGLGAEVLLYFATDHFLTTLDEKKDNAMVQLKLGEFVSTNIREMEASFYQITTQSNPYKMDLIETSVLGNIERIRSALSILSNGGEFHYEINLNLPDQEALYETLIYDAQHNKGYAIYAIDIHPKLKALEKRLSDLKIMLSTYYALTEPALAVLQQQNITKHIKSTVPLFNRLIENTNRLYYNNQLDIQRFSDTIESQKNIYRFIQIAFSALVLVLVLGLMSFRFFSRQIETIHTSLQNSQQHARDILNAQSNIVVVSDGHHMLDVSGGFFDFFTEYDSIESFVADYPCICDTFSKEPGYVYKFDDQNWMHYILNHPDDYHRAKIRRDHQVHTFNVSAKKSSTLDHYIVSMFDITELEQYTNELKVERNKAWHAARSKSEFLANMSHEIRTPINAILGFIQLLQEKITDEESLKYLKIINSSSQTLLGIINDILDFSKIENNKLDLDKVEFSPQDEFQSTADLFTAKCQEKDLLFDVRMENLPDSLISDPLRIKQIVANLLSNAVKFTPEGKRIGLDVHYDEAQAQLTIRVTDQGIGIAADKMDTIFKAFSQAESSTTRRFGGTGLGLTISHRLTQMLGGQLQVRSEPGKGSEFYFTIPAVKGSGYATSKAPIKEDQTFRGHILLVEDNATNQMLMSAILKKLQLTFDVAHDGNEAVECFHQHDYDLILMDENMPNKSGSEATRLIRQLEKDSDLSPMPIIALTANAMVEDRERFIAAGMSDYLTKPIELPALIQQFETYLREPRKTP